MTTAKPPNSASSPPQSPPQKNPRMNPEIPEEVIFTHILPRIPAKFLVRFKLVSHQWNSFLSNPTTHFVNSHLSLSSTLNSRSVLTYYFDHTPDSAIVYMSIEYENGLEFAKFGTNLRDRMPLFLLSSCNGLVFSIYALKQKSNYYSELPYDLHEFEFRYLVCNPVLGIDSFVEIEHPHDHINLGDCRNKCYGFGFGCAISSLDDYYIVVITLPMTPLRPEIVFHVYSLRDSEWRTPRKFKQNKLPFAFCSSSDIQIGTLVNGTLHWGVVVANCQKWIVAFDLGAQDKFEFMKLPKDKAEFGDVYFYLCCLNDCLCACGIYADADNGGEVVEMWMLKEYGVNKPWTKLFRCNFGCYCRMFFGLTKAGMGLIHLYSDPELRLVDFTRDPPQDMRIENEHLMHIWEVVDYVESFVSPRAIISKKSKHDNTSIRT